MLAASKIERRARGPIPCVDVPEKGFWSSPHIVKDLPVPVRPYAKMQTLLRSRTWIRVRVRVSVRG